MDNYSCTVSTSLVRSYPPGKGIMNHNFPTSSQRELWLITTLFDRAWGQLGGLAKVGWNGVNLVDSWSAHIHMHAYTYTSTYVYTYTQQQLPHTHPCTCTHTAGLSMLWFLPRVCSGVQSGCEVHWWHYKGRYHPWPHLSKPEMCPCECTCTNVYDGLHNFERSESSDHANDYTHGIGKIVPRK